MASICRVVFLLMVFTLLNSSVGEIHRATIQPTVSSTYSQSSIFAFLPQHDLSSESIYFSIIATSLIGCAGIVPLLFIPMDTGETLRDKESPAAKRLQKFLAFAVGALLGDVFLHLLPEAYASSTGIDAYDHIYIGLWVLCGLISFMIIEMLMNEEDQEESLDSDPDVQKSSLSPSIHNPSVSENNISQNKNERKTHPKQEAVEERQIDVSGYLNLLANCIDNFTHGLAIGGSYHSSVRLGHLTTLAILLHEVPHEISDFAILLRAGFDRWGAAKAQLVTATASIAGTFVGLNGGAFIGSTRWILPFTSGGFLYISLVSVLPDLIKQKETLTSAIQQLFFVFLGVASMSLVNLLHN